jgi:hypothetical protein
VLILDIARDEALVTLTEILKGLLRISRGVGVSVEATNSYSSSTSHLTGSKGRVGRRGSNKATTRSREEHFAESVGRSRRSRKAV